MSTFEAGKPFGPWIRGIARNVVRRLQSRRPGADLVQPGRVAQLLAVREDGAVLSDHADRFQLKYLQECLKGLPQKSATILRHRCFEGKPSSEISRILNLTPEAVRMALVRIRLQLKSCVAGLLFPAPEHLRF